ncbi:MAG: nicotinate (nicotinamide) nucleotide adenylyltransferase [Magnetococcales bacterium]|nr:nicotinate (nicotinamide) nucleotide adenylyltransferase [Magnetococcales bacterium]
MTQRIGILGGAFNPPHFGHARIGVEVCEALKLDRLLWLPSGGHPFKGEDVLLPVAHRVEMTRLTIAGQAQFELCTLEAEKSGTSYTSDTLTALNQRHPDALLVFLMGVDNLAELHLWKGWQDLDRHALLCLLTRPGYGGLIEDSQGSRFYQPTPIKQARFDLPSEARKGCHLLPVTALDISSSDLRKRLQQGHSIRYLTPDSVIDHIHRHQLYTSLKNITPPADRHPENS